MIDAATSTTMRTASTGELQAIWSTSIIAETTFFVPPVLFYNEAAMVTKSRISGVPQRTVMSGTSCCSTFVKPITYVACSNTIQSTR